MATSNALFITNFIVAVSGGAFVFNRIRFKRQRVQLGTSFALRMKKKKRRENDRNKENWTKKKLTSSSSDKMDVFWPRSTSSCSEEKMSISSILKVEESFGKSSKVPNGKITHSSSSSGSYRTLIVALCAKSASQILERAVDSTVGFDPAVVVVVVVIRWSRTLHP